MKQMVTELVIVAAVGIALAGCSSGKADKKADLPKELTPLAAQFKQQSGENRMELGSQIRVLLPTCVSANAEGGGSVSDYSKPSYFLSRQQTVGLLGTPNDDADGDLVYYLGAQGRTNWDLRVEFHDDHAVLARMHMDMIRQAAPSAGE